MGGAVASGTASVDVDRTPLYVICASVMFIGTLILLAGGGMPFEGRIGFLTFLGAFFMLVAALGFGYPGLLRLQAAQRASGVRLGWGGAAMLVMAMVSILAALACIASLLVT